MTSNGSTTALEGRVAIVTGAARTQGRAHCLHLARMGADICALDIAQDDPVTSYSSGSRAELDETVRLVEQEGRRAIAAIADVTDAAAVDGAIAKAVEVLGSVDIVVSNAGVLSSGLSWELSEEAWDRVIDVNLKGPWNVARAVVPHMIARGKGGSIINVGSTASVKGIAYMSHYAAAKHGLVGLTKSLSLEVGQYAIRCNLIVLTTTNTPMAHNTEIKDLFSAGRGELTDERWEAMNRKVHVLPTPWIEPEDAASVVGFLASDAARFVTGASYAVDAGYTLK